MKLLAIAALAGCAHHAEVKKDQPIASSSNVDRAQSAGPSAATTTTTCSVDSDCGSKQLCIREQCVDVTADLAECAMMRVHFAFNSSEIDPADKTALERSARCLKADHALHVAIEGNADERGTEEYNLALGDRRATSVATWLESLGTSATQLKTVSFGKENPLCIVHDEACWASNRRASVKPKELAAGHKR
jgi:peptidoglycan-associated lipoprotein